MPLKNQLSVLKRFIENRKFHCGVRFSFLRELPWGSCAERTRSASEWVSVSRKSRKVSVFPVIRELRKLSVLPYHCTTGTYLSLWYGKPCLEGIPQKISGRYLLPELSWRLAQTGGWICSIIYSRIRCYDIDHYNENDIDHYYGNDRHKIKVSFLRNDALSYHHNYQLKKLISMLEFMYAVSWWQKC